MSTAAAQSNGTAHHNLHRPHLLNHSSPEKPSPPPSPISKSTKDPRSSTPVSSNRRNSWMSSISSKFSSTPSPQINGTQSNAAGAQKARTPQAEQSNPFGAAFSPSAKDLKKADTNLVQPMQSPKPAHPSFLQNALRRLSSSGPNSMGKMTGTGGICERKTMNVDPYRQRCDIPELEPMKLRKVAFCVDVEIAALPKYVEEDTEPPSSPPPGRRPSLTQLENQVDIRKRKDEKLKRSEGEALKNSNVAMEETASAGSVGATEEIESERITLGKTSADIEVKEPTKKKEKKKRSEEERKERKERKRNEALANGTLPVELQSESSNNRGPSTSTPGSETSPKPQDRPTTDPLRIYRRCCQLRETPILKRITEQIGAPSACPVATPGILLMLDLSNYLMQLPDLNTLSDYLAVVPVKKLIMENCGLTDEGIRVILAGLLAVKTPEQAKYNKRLGKQDEARSIDKLEHLGVVEKISFKNNPQIGRDGWRHIAFFMYMSRSIKAMDLSMIPLPKPSTLLTTTTSSTQLSDSTKISDIPTLLKKALGERPEGSRLEELVMAECGLDAAGIEKIVEGVMGSSVTRLGLANNSMTLEGLEHVLRYVKAGRCEGLDLGGNDLREHLGLLAHCLDEKNALYALSLAGCNLLPLSLEPLLPTLVRLPNFRFIDLSHNHDLFTSQPSALGLLRKYIPQFPVIKRIHLLDVALSSENAIALAEILPESPSLAHLNILENEPLLRLASAKDEASQEEACALYASLMIAVRVSTTIICIDIDVPGDDSTEVVKALAKQVIAYSLRNLERMSLSESSNETGAAPTVDFQGVEKEVYVPDVLLHLVGHVDGFPENHDQDDPAPDDDYIVGGNGVVKALGVCLNRAAEVRKARSLTPGQSGTATPRQAPLGDEQRRGKAKEMSKDLLHSARKIRARLLPALIKEASAGNEINYSKYTTISAMNVSDDLPERLQFLDSTLERVIQRFESEYPETRLTTSSSSSKVFDPNHDTNLVPSTGKSPVSPSGDDPDAEESSEEDDAGAIKIPLLRRSSDVSLASRSQAQEEGLMHRFGQRVRRDILRPQSLDYAHSTTGEETEAQHLQELRKKLDGLDGAEIRQRMERVGPEALFEAIGATAEELFKLENQDPEVFEILKEAKLTELYNLGGPDTKKADTKT